MADFAMPVLGADMEAGTLVAWRKHPGDVLRRGDILAEVDTEKGVIDVEVFHAGVLEATLVSEGAKVPVGTVIARIRDDVAAERPAQPPGAAPAPSARAAPPAPGADRFDRMRRTIAAAMARSKREIPHYYLAHTIDLGRATAWLAEVNAARPVERRLLPGVLLLKAAALAVREAPELNAVWDGGRVVVRDAVHVGVAIALRGGGLVILALHDSATRPVDDLMDGLRELTARARSGRMRSSDLADSTLTVTSLGDRGVEAVWGVIYPPQVAIVGFGRLLERPWVVDGGVVARPLVTVTLSADHRASDGHRGGLYLDAVDRLLQEPEKL